MNMSIEGMILTGFYLISITAFLFLLLRKPIETPVVFLFHQLPTWLFGLLVVEAGWIQYPVREFQVATKTSFMFEYLAFPVISCYFVVFYPENRSNIKKLLYYTAFCLGITIPEILIEKNTRLIQYVTWSWYWTFISVWITLFITLLFFRWFFAHRGRMAAG